MIRRLVVFALPVLIEADSESGFKHAVQDAKADLHIDVAGVSIEHGGYWYRSFRKGRKVLSITTKC